MKVFQTWKRNKPSTISGESITIMTTYSSFNPAEIDELERQMPNGAIVGDNVISRSALLSAYDAEHVGQPGKARKLIEDAPAIGQEAD